MHPATWQVLALMMVSGNLTVFSAIAAGRAESDLRKWLYLFAQGLLLAGLLAAAIYIPYTLRGENRAAGVLLGLLAFILALLLGGGLVALQYVLTARSARFREDLGQSLWLSARGIRRLDGR